MVNGTQVLHLIGKIPLEWNANVAFKGYTLNHSLRKQLWAVIELKHGSYGHLQVKNGSKLRRQRHLSHWYDIIRGCIFAINHNRKWGDKAHSKVSHQFTNAVVQQLLQGRSPARMLERKKIGRKEWLKWVLGTHLLAPHWSLHSRTPLRSFIWSLAHSPSHSL